MLERVSHVTADAASRVGGSQMLGAGNQINASVLIRLDIPCCSDIGVKQRSRSRPVLGRSLHEEQLGEIFVGSQSGQRVALFSRFWVFLLNGCEGEKIGRRQIMSELRSVHGR